MSRMIFSINQCSPVEQRMLKALRAVNWVGSWPAQAGFFLEEIGFSSTQAIGFALLIETIVKADPGFELLGPMSPFISRDELNILAALGNASRKNSNNGSGAPHDGTSQPLKSLIDNCGTSIRMARVQMKTRTMLQNGRTLPAIACQVVPFHNDNSLRRVEVVSIHQPTPKVRRIVVSGHSLKSFVSDLPGQWVKIFLPDAKGPSVGRAFTIRDFDSTAHQLTFDIALHEGGPMSAWGLKARIGDVLDVAGPRGGFKGASPRSWLLLAGDETALPALASIIRQLPASLHVHLFIEVTDESEQQFLATQPRVQVRWVYREGSGSQPAETLAEVLRFSPLPTTGGDAWIAAEATTVRSIRTHLLRERGFEPGRVHAAGYWKKGEQDHCDLAAG